MNTIPVRVLFLVENYHGFYTSFLWRHGGLSDCTYEEQCNMLFAQHFYQGDSYAHAGAISVIKPPS